MSDNRQLAIGNRYFLIVGLGNPGPEYEWTRHNLGFMLIDKLAADFNIPVTRRECRSFVGRGDTEGVSIKLAKPQTYMNLSGEAVGCLVAKQNLMPPYENLVVLVDDLALSFGTIRIRARGTAGGHNGLKSIISALGTNEFTRLRIGIQPDHPVADSKRFVLDSFSRAVRPEVEQVLDTSAAAVRTILRDGVLKAMTEYNASEK